MTLKHSAAAATAGLGWRVFHHLSGFCAGLRDLRLQRQWRSLHVDEARRSDPRDPSVPAVSVHHAVAVASRRRDARPAEALRGDNSVLRASAVVSLCASAVQRPSPINVLAARNRITESQNSGVDAWAAGKKS
jgi:hypothetical protein